MALQELKKATVCRGCKKVFIGIDSESLGCPACGCEHVILLAGIAVADSVIKDCDEVAGAVDCVECFYFDVNEGEECRTCDGSSNFICDNWAATCGNCEHVWDMRKSVECPKCGTTYHGRA